MNSTTETMASAATSGPTAAAAAAGESGKCQLLGNFAILVQGALGALALLSLVYKRWRERPQRPVKVWAFDVSKQVVGSVLLHLANLLMSMFSAGEIEATIAKAAADSLAKGPAAGDGEPGDDHYRPNPCSFYLLNIAIDTTLGIPILLVILKVITIGLTRLQLVKPPESIKSGHYGTPPKAKWWLKQSVIYFFGLVLMKVCVLLIFELAPWIVIVGDWALKWTEGNEAVQIAFVMFIFPLIMNAMQYYIIDTFIKDKPSTDSSETQPDDNDADDERERFLAGDEEGGSRHSGDGEDADKDGITGTGRDYPRRVITPYDPVRDGEAETISAESSNGGKASSPGPPTTRGQSHS